MVNPWLAIHEETNKKLQVITTYKIHSFPHEYLSYINAVVTPLCKAASYEQRKTDKFRKFPVTVTYYHIVPRITQHKRGYPSYHHVGDTSVDRADFTWQKASRRPRKGPVATTYCLVDAVFATG